jgi:hypothetical protein
MRLAWKSLVPMCLALVALQGLILFLGWSQWVALPGNIVILVLGAVVGAAGGTPVTGRQLSLLRRDAESA